MTPDILSLFQSSIVIKNIEVDSLILTQRAIGKLSELSKTGVTPPLQPPTRLRLEAIHFINAQLILGKMNFGPFEASVHLGGNSKLVEASIATLDGKLKAVVKPDQSNYLIDARDVYKRQNVSSVLTATLTHVDRLAIALRWGSS